jgi:hypothetical protein
MVSSLAHTAPMNREELRKNIDRTFRFVPPPRRDSADGSWESDMNLWILRRETEDKKGFEFLNAIRDHEPLVLGHEQIRNFDAPDKLVLRGQVILEGADVKFDPFHPKPASLSISTVSLRMRLQGTGEDDALCMTAPPIFPLTFIVENTGQQTVRDFRTTVLVPSAFTKTSIGFAASAASDLAELSLSGNVKVFGHLYLEYEDFISQPIYKGERVRIGSLPLKADYGEYNFLWQIRCDDGIFPNGDDFGKITVKVVPLVDFVTKAVKELHKS